MNAILVLHCRLSLVDLAGSESTGRAETNGERRTEGVNINKGLSVLGRCVGAICRKEKHIPFRDSNLTKVRDIPTIYY